MAIVVSHSTGIAPSSPNALAFWEPLYRVWKSTEFGKGDKTEEVSIAGDH